MAPQRRIGIIVYNDVQGLDIVGPADAFAAATLNENGRTVQAYEISFNWADCKASLSESGIASPTCKFCQFLT